jgi:hypothetical protein
MRRRTAMTFTARHAFTLATARTQRAGRM